MTPNHTPKTAEFLTTRAAQAITSLQMIKMLSCKLRHGPDDVPSIMLYAMPANEVNEKIGEPIDDDASDERVVFCELHNQSENESDFVFAALTDAYNGLSILPTWFVFVFDCVACNAGKGEKQSIQKEYSGLSLQEIHAQFPHDTRLSEAFTALCFDSRGNYCSGISLYGYNDEGMPAFQEIETTYHGNVFDTSLDNILGQRLIKQIVAFLVITEVARTGSTISPSSLFEKHRPK